MIKMAKPPKDFDEHKEMVADLRRKELRGKYGVK